MAEADPKVQIGVGYTRKAYFLFAKPPFSALVTSKIIQEDVGVNTYGATRDSDTGPYLEWRLDVPDPPNGKESAISIAGSVGAIAIEFGFDAEVLAEPVDFSGGKTSIGTQ